MSMHSSPPSRHRASSKAHDDFDFDTGTLPAPNTYTEYKRSKQMQEKGSYGIRPAGESGRRGFHPVHFSRITFKSTSRASLLCNLLWPVVPAAIAVRCMFLLSCPDVMCHSQWLSLISQMPYLIAIHSSSFSPTSPWSHVPISLDLLAKSSRASSLM